MGTKAIAIANIIVIQYLLTSHYNLPHKWEWLVLTAIVLAALLAKWGASPKRQDEKPAGRDDHRQQGS